MEQQLVACVQESLALYLHDNARFMAERLLAEFPSEASRSVRFCIVFVLHPVLLALI